jgi:hypothetical protein
MCIQDQPYHLLPTPMILSCSLDYLRRDLDIGLAMLKEQLHHLFPTPIILVEGTSLYVVVSL